mmetsp:Transcript_100391/g.306820  ORF Transcript_100391/g.306820 Transcript_100391/m.306820 type:complete len:260 (+) Transcript_100391:278-1057(+)
MLQHLRQVVERVVDVLAETVVLVCERVVDRRVAKLDDASWQIARERLHVEPGRLAAAVQRGHGQVHEPAHDGACHRVDPDVGLHLELQEGELHHQPEVDEEVDPLRVDDQIPRLHDAAERFGVIAVRGVHTESDEVGTREHLRQLGDGAVRVARLAPIPDQVEGPLGLLVVAVRLVHGGRDDVGAWQQLQGLRQSPVLAQVLLQGISPRPFGGFFLAVLLVHETHNVRDAWHELSGLGDHAICAEPLLRLVRLVRIVLF